MAVYPEKYSKGMQKDQNEGVKGKNALITEAISGIGQAVAIRLA